MAAVTFPRVDRPVLSVVMVTYGGWDWPRRALEALLEHTDPVFEVVVVDNASPDETPARLREEVRGARLLFNERNLGFGPAANQGAAETTGRYLCFLNPDALVQPGWLPPLLETLEGSSGAGAVVPRFLAPDGRVDEAGSLVDRDARTLAYGRGEEAADPRFRFRRVIDYGSAACLVMPAWTFRRVGGFDPVFHPAYCEDVDLMLSVRALGLATVYDPRSTVIHAGAASSNDVVRAALIERNRPILLERWRDELADRPSLIGAEDHPHRAVAIRDASAPDRLMIATEEGGDQRLESLAGSLAESRRDIRVTVMRLAREAGRVPSHPGEDLLARGAEAVTPVDPSAWLDDYRLHYTAVILDGPRVAGRLEEGLRRSQPGVLRAYSPAGVADPTHPRGATGWRAAEISAIRAATAVLCRSEAETRMARMVAPAVPLFMLADEESFPEFLALLGITPAVPAGTPA
jgi:GT2 family glycosyltransferase